MSKRFSKYESARWELVSLESISLPVERINRNYQEQSETFSYIDIESVDNKTFSLKGIKEHTWGTAPSRAQQIVRSGDILFSTVRPYLKNIAAITDKYDGNIASSGFCVIRPVLVNPKYIFNYILNQSFINSVGKNAKGTSYPAVTNKVIFAQKIPIPPLLEQNRIVTKLDELFSQLDICVASLQEAQNQLLVYRYALQKTAFEGTLTEEWREQNKPEFGENIFKHIKTDRKKRHDKELLDWNNKILQRKKLKTDQSKKPKESRPINDLTKSELDGLPKIPTSWRWIKMGEFEELITSGSTPKGGKNVYLKNGIPFIRSQNIYSGRLDLRDLVYIKKQTHESMKRSHLKSKDVLLNITGASIGRSAFVPENFETGNVNQHVCIIRSFTERIDHKFLSSYFNSPIAQRIIGLINSGATREALTFEQIRNFPFPLMSLREQNEIFNCIDLQTSLVDNLDQAITDNLNKSNSFRQSILKMAFEGKLVTSNPSDESATKLLQKIKETKAEYIDKQNTMKKMSRIKSKTKQKEKTILEVLESSKKPLSAKVVWEQSKHKSDIEAFYSELKKLQGKVIEIKKGILSLTK